MNDDFPDFSSFRTKNGWRIKPKLEGDPIYAAYVQRVAEEQRKLRPPKPRPVKPEGMTEEEFQFSLQPKSTQEILLAQKDPNYVRDWTAPLPENAQVKDADGNVFINERSTTEEEILLIEDIRRAPKNELGAAFGSGSSQETKDSATQAFLDEKATLSVSDIVGIRSGEINVHPYAAKEPTWEKIPVWKAIWFKLIGKQVRYEKE